MEATIKCQFSVVVPVYNSEQTLEELYRRLETVFKEMGQSFEVIFVNDHSRDQSYAVLREIHKAFPENTIVIDLLRNYGQHNATMCGFNYCQGNYIVTIDDDLQNPPEEIPLLWEKMKEGSDVVFAIPNEKKHRFYKNLGSVFVRKLNHWIFNLKGGVKFASFRMIRKEIVDEIKLVKTPYPYISGMLLTITRSIANQEVEHHTRQLGRSNYNLRKLIRLALNLLINYSSIPLRFIGISGLLISMLSFIIGLVYMLKQYFTGKAPEGWTTLVVLVSFYNAILLVFFSVLGEYISRLLKESSKTSQYAVRNIHGKMGLRPSSSQVPDPKTLAAD